MCIKKGDKILPAVKDVLQGFVNDHLLPTAPVVQSWSHDRAKSITRPRSAYIYVTHSHVWSVSKSPEAVFYLRTYIVKHDRTP